MPERPDLRSISGNIRDALADCDRDTLLDILTFVFKEYLVEGPPPLLAHQVERLPDLEGLSFAQLIAALQTRLDHPELSLFQVENEQVSVRVGGVLTPLMARRRGPSDAAAAPPSAPARRPTPGVQVVETEFVRRPPPRSGRSSVDEAVARGRADLAGIAHDAVNQAMRQQNGSAPPPRRGLSIGGRPTGGTMMPSSPSSPGSSAAGPPPPREAARSGGQDSSNKKDDDKPRPEPLADDDNATTRFSLLELD